MLEPRFEQVPDVIDSTAELIKASEEINHRLWPITPEINQTAYQTNGDADMSFSEAVESMINAYKTKLAWLDTKIKSL